MILYVMRHGAAEDWASGGDLARPLTAAGRAASERVAQELLGLRRCPVPRVLCSPALRAQQTAEQVARRAGAPGLQCEVFEDLRPEVPPPLELVQALKPMGEDVLIVGHWPWVESLVASLLEPGEETPHFCTAYLAGVDLDRGLLIHCVDPRYPAL